MKKLIATVIAIIAILTMTIPAMAVNTEVTIGNGDGDPASGGPYVVAKFETPDDINGEADGINILPEASIPPFNTDSTNGWKLVKYYLIMDDPQGDAQITGADIEVYYPDGTLKYNLHVDRCRGSGPYTDVFGSYYWSVSGGPGPESYPDGSVANVPPQIVRELNYWPAGNWSNGIVDTNADRIIGNDTDKPVDQFLTYYGTRVTYGNNPDLGVPFNATTTAALLTGRESDNTGKAIMIEVKSYIWCHQDPVWYTVSATAIASEQSAPLTNIFQFVPQACLYLDFDTVDFGSVTPPQPPATIAYANRDGDSFINTPTLPTVWNNGNYAGQVTVGVTKMLWDANDDGIISGTELGEGAITGKHLDSFDISLDLIQGGTVIQSGHLVLFSAISPQIIRDNNGYPVELLPCTPTQIDFSLGVPPGVNNGDYYGTITLTIDNYVGPPFPVDPFVVGP